MLPTSVRAMRPSLTRFSYPSGSASGGRSFAKYFMKKCFAIEAIPIWAISGCAICGGSWYLTRLARGPDVIWDRNAKPKTWEDQITPAVSPEYSGEGYKRGRL
ncbi:hypothetical protein BDY24DRAFT_443713 [Mrakia frigida]|uniref:uncharacterized protein n=1 Tax=Mrakia frigida TaxID=29902 RepID=UPI003FCBF2FF